MKFSLLFFAVFLSLTLKLSAEERELISEENIDITLAPNPIICRNEEWIGRGFTMYFPGEITIGAHLIESEHPLLEDLSTFSFILPASVTCESLQFNEMPRHTYVTQRVFRKIAQGQSDREVLKALLVVETSLQIPVMLDGENIQLIATRDPWVSHAHYQGEPMDAYQIRIYPQAHPVSCKPYDAEEVRYALTISNTSGFFWDRISNVRELSHIFATKDECTAFHTKLLSHYRLADPANHGTMILINRDLKRVVEPQSSSDLCLEFEEEIASMDILDLKFEGLSRSFPLNAQNCP